jgi:pimeloyl-CoA synthetase
MAPLSISKKKRIILFENLKETKKSLFWTRGHAKNTHKLEWLDTNVSNLKTIGKEIKKVQCTVNENTAFFSETNASICSDGKFMDFGPVI